MFHENKESLDKDLAYQHYKTLNEVFNPAEWILRMHEEYWAATEDSGRAQELADKQLAYQDLNKALACAEDIREKLLDVFHKTPLTEDLDLLCKFIKDARVKY